MRKPHVSFTAATLVLSLSLFAARAARADGPSNPWVDRPLSLKPLTLDIEAGLGVGQVPSGTGYSAATGANLEAAVGLPILGEIGLRTGVGFGDNGKIGGVDYFGRLFDHQTMIFNRGADTFANPEIRWKNTFVDAELVAVGTELRLVVPIASNTDTGLEPGIPVRIRIPHLLRIDTGLYVPIDFASSVEYSFSVPIEAYFQVSNFFFGPLTGVRFDHFAVPATPVTKGTSNNQGDIPAGIGAGYTLGGMLDLKAQLYTLRINDSNWSNTIGGGVGVGLLLP